VTIARSAYLAPYSQRSSTARAAPFQASPPSASREERNVVTVLSRTMLAASA